MADIPMKCKACGETTQVSQYVDPEMATCGSCGEKLKVPKAVIAAQPKGPSEAPKEKSDESNVAAVFIDEDGASRAAKIKKRQLKRKKRIARRKWSPSGGSMLAVAVVVAGVLLFLNFGNALSDGDKETLRIIGVGAVFLVHFIVCADAFNDAPMNGILSLAVPGYSIYYLYSRCDSMVLRTAMACFLIPFCVQVVQAEMAAFMYVINALRGSSLGDTEGWVRPPPAAN